MRKEKWGYKACGLGETTVIFSRGMSGRSSVIVDWVWMTCIIICDCLYCD